MLSRTAAEIYWLSRYLERAENAARMLDVAWSMSMMPSVAARDEMVAMLDITGCLDDYRAQKRNFRPADILHFLTLDTTNPSSIFNSLRMARENAHAVRGKITSEMWESINSTWIEAQQIQEQGIEQFSASGFFDWVKQRSHCFRGAALSTMMQSEAFHFLRIGTFLERADNTARLLSTRQIEVSSPPDEATNYYRWNAVLRSVGAFEAYRDRYREGISFDKVAELLITRSEAPRSLLACINEVCSIMLNIEGNAGNSAKQKASIMQANLRYADMTRVMQFGVIEYLEVFLRDISELADTLRLNYLEPQ